MVCGESIEPWNEPVAAICHRSLAATIDLEKLTVDDVIKLNKDH